MSKTLRGKKVVSLAQNLPGPYVAFRLAEAGAQVIKIESPQGDPLKLFYPDWYNRWVENQTVVVTNLNEIQGKQTLHSELKDAQLLLTSQRPQWLTQLQIESSKMEGLFPQLSWISIVGFAFPNENQPGHDLNYQAKAGLLSPPHMPEILLADYFGAEQAYSASLLALIEQQQSGRGSHKQVSLTESLKEISLFKKLGVTSGEGPLSGHNPLYNLYPASDGWVSLSALEPAFEERLKLALNLKVIDHKKLESAFSKQGIEFWNQFGLDNDLPLLAF